MCPTPFTSGGAQVLGLIVKDLPTYSADEAKIYVLLLLLISSYAFGMDKATKEYLAQRNAPSTIEKLLSCLEKEKSGGMCPYINNVLKGDNNFKSIYDAAMKLANLPLNNGYEMNGGFSLVRISNKKYLKWTSWCNSESCSKKFKIGSGTNKFLYDLDGKMLFVQYYDLRDASHVIGSPNSEEAKFLAAED